MASFGFGRSSDSDTDFTTLLGLVSEDSLESKIKDLCNAGGYQSRISFTEGNYYSAEYIARYFESLPTIAYVKRDTFRMQYADYPYNTKPLINIIATLEGSEPDSGIIIIGGHYDDSGSREQDWNYYTANWQTLKAQGADDNGTGVASIMEIARILSDPNNHFQSKYTIQFMAFGAEEYHPVHKDYHHLGSQYDAQKRSQNHDPLKAVLVIDMVGYNLNYDYVEVISNSPSRWIADSVYVYRDRYLPNLLTNSSPSDVPYSDHDSYQQKGYHAILLMESDRPWNNDTYYSANPYYHKTSDVLSHLNISLVRQVAQLALATIAHLSEGIIVTGIKDYRFLENRLPDDFALRAYPNPFNPIITLEFILDRPGDIELNVYDIRGKLVKNVVKGFFRPGRHQVQWNATDEYGHKMASGSYFYSLKAENKVITKKMLLIR